MNGKSNLSGLSTEKLIKRRNLLKGVFAGFAILWLFMMGVSLYVLLTRATGRSFIPAVALPLALLPAWLQMKALNEEIKSRETAGNT